MSPVEAYRRVRPIGFVMSPVSSRSPLFHFSMSTSDGAALCLRSNSSDSLPPVMQLDDGLRGAAVDDVDRPDVQMEVGVVDDRDAVEGVAELEDRDSGDEVSLPFVSSFVMSLRALKSTLPYPVFVIGATVRSVAVFV